MPGRARSPRHRPGAEPDPEPLQRRRDHGRRPGRPRAPSRPSARGWRSSSRHVLLEAIAAYTAVVREPAVLELARGNEERLRRSSTPPATASGSGDVTEDRHPPGRDRATPAASPIGSRPRARSTSRRPTTRRSSATQPGRLELPAPPDAPPADRRRWPTPERQLGWQARHSSWRRPRPDRGCRSARAPRLTLGGEVGYARRRQPYTVRQGTPRSAPPRRCRSTRAAASMPGCGRAGSCASQRPLRPRRRAPGGETAITDRHGTTSAPPRRRSARSSGRSTPRRFAVDGVRQEALVGARTVVDVLDAERELFAAEVGLAPGRARAGARGLPPAGRGRPADRART